MKDLTEDTTIEHSEVLNTLVGSKVFYVFQEELSRGLKAPQQLINKLALNITLACLWKEYWNRENWSIDYGIYEALCQCKGYSELAKEYDLSWIYAKTFEEFISILKERK